MSDIATDTAVVDTGATPAPDVSGASSAPDTSSESTGVFDDLNFDKEFGLEPEVKTGEPPTDDKAPDPPVPHQDTKEVKPGTETTEPAKAEAAKSDADKKPDEFQFNEKLNWDDDKQPFREEFKALKEEYLKVRENSVEAQYINSPQEFAKWMKETSPTSFNEVGGVLATESAKSHPKEWIEYFAKEQPDMLAQIVSGREGMTAERLKAELSVILDEDDADVQAALERGKTAAETKPEETPEQKRVREILDREDRKEGEQAMSEVFTPIESEVNSLVSEAGLDINLKDYQGKNFNDLDDDTQFKVMANEMLPMYIEYRVSQDPKLSAMQARMQLFLATKDEQGNPKKPDVASAKRLLHPMRIAVSNIVGDYLRVTTGKRAEARKSETAIPANAAPPPVVKGAGNGSVPVDLSKPLVKDDWSGAMP